MYGGVTIALPGQGGMTAPDGAVFNGWAAGGQNYAADADYIVNADTIFTAQWVASDGNPFVGTWTGTDSSGNNLTVTIGGSDWECSSFQGYMWKGAYTRDDNTGTLTVSNIKSYSDADWIVVKAR